jgi:hypothetical protein
MVRESRILSRAAENINRTRLTGASFGFDQRTDTKNTIPKSGWLVKFRLYNSITSGVVQH